MKIIFRVDDKWKMSSMFVGSSPEFDMAIYTLCYSSFILSEQKAKCRLEMADCALVRIDKC
jgi:hypothetical protein